jgi:hypothetical protein
MRSVEFLFGRARTLLLVGLVGMLAACGGSTTSSSTTICKDPAICPTDLAVQAMPTGPNTTEIVVDSGPLGAFVLGVTNVPYVTVTVCSPNMITNDSCVTIDHVLLDTGSYGLRLLKSKLGSVALPSVAIAANASNNTPAGDAAECYPFVIGTIWGPLAKADVHIGGELAYAQTIQLIDDGQTQSPPVPQNCLDAAQGSLLTSVSTLQANGILGVGMVAIDCGLTCLDNAYPGMHYVYYSCPTGGASCMPAAVPLDMQVQNPVVGFVADSNGKFNNNGTMITMPALPKLGAKVAKGRLVFGIGTQANNTPAVLGQFPVDTDPASANYLYVSMQSGGQTYAQSYIDSGSNAMFFDSADPSLAGTCNVSTGGQQGGWYCPAATWSQPATLTAANGAQGTFTLSVDSADALFSINGATAFDNLAGSAGQGASTFALGMPFFYGRKVYTSIWDQLYSTLNGPWYAIE